MKRSIVLVLVVGLVAVQFVGPVEAKKKKKKKRPAPVAASANFYIRDEVEGCEDDPVLSVVDGPDVRPCSFITNGVANEVLMRAAPDEAGTYTFAGRDGVPFVLDGSREIAIDFTLRSWQPTVGGQPSPVHLGGGAATLDMTITGTSGGETKEIAKGSASFTTHPASPRANIKTSLKPDEALDKAEFTTIELVTTVRGAAVLTGWFVLDDPASFFTVPVLQ